MAAASSRYDAADDRHPRGRCDDRRRLHLGERQQHAEQPRPRSARADPPQRRPRTGRRRGGGAARQARPLLRSGPEPAALRPVPLPRYCAAGVDVTGVDLTKLADRQVAGRAVQGRAELTGVYRGHTLVVTQQGPPGPDADPDLPSHPPCPAPHGGWPTGPRDENFDFSPVTSYAAAHPGTVLAPAELRPSATQTVAYALTTADPRTVTKALRPYYGARLCVERSRYTQAAINRAAAVFVRRMNGSDGIWSVGSGGLDLRAQPSVDVYLVRVTPAIAALAAAQPAGLVLLHPWLFPVKQ